MRLQSISIDAAQMVWNKNFKGEAPDLSFVNIEQIGGDQELLSDFELDDLVEAFRDIQSKYEGKNFKSGGGLIDAELPEILHSKLIKLADTHQLTDMGFWRWLSNIACNGFFWDFIMWRLNSDRVINWGITNASNAVEIYLYRAWLRGHKMFDTSLNDPYKYARKGSSDVWRSHILRQDFGRDREFVKAFLDTVYDDSGRTVIGTTELRQSLIPSLRAWSSTATFSHLSYSENLELIRYLRRPST